MAEDRNGIERRLAEAEATLEALHRGEVDAIVGREDVMLLSLRNAAVALRASQDRYDTLLRSIDQGFCIVEMIFDDAGKPVDYRFLETNHAFETHTGLPDAVGRRMRELAPGHEQSWYEHFGRVAATGERMQFESTARALGRVFEVFAYRVDAPELRRVAALFKDVTDQALAAERRRQTEEALRRSEERWNAALEHFSGGVIIADEHGQWLYWNPAARRMHGMTASDGVDALSTPLFELWTADGHARLQHTDWPVARLKKGEVVDRLELRLRRPDRGWERVVSYSGATVATSSGERLIFLSLDDLTEQRKAERELRESEMRFRRLADTMPQLVWTATAGGIVDYYNTQVTRYSGIRQSGDGSWNWHPILHPDDVERTKQAWEHATVTGETYECEHRVRMADGTFRWHLSRAHRVGPADAMQWFGTATDIHELKLAEERLRESEQRFKIMANTAPAMLWITNEHHQCTFLSRGWYDFTGQRSGDGLGFGWLDVVHEDDRQRTREAYLTAAERHEPFLLDFRLCSADGGYRWTIDAGRPRFDDSGTFLGFIGSVFDVHERKQAEEALRDADRRKDDFLAVLAHELRNPLAPLRNGLEVLRRARPDSDGARTAREMMERQVDQMVRLIDDLLDTSRIARGKFELHRTAVDLVETVRHALETSRPLLDAAGHRLRVELPERPLIVHADPVRVAQVLTNLLNNAAHYTDRGGRVTIAVRSSGDEAFVEVEDDGVGIPADMLEQVFEPFVQLETSIRRGRQNGLGLGLALARSIVNLHGGSIRASAGRDGRGSLFTVRLPLSGPAAGSVDRELGGGRESGSGLRVLVVDDNRDAAESLGMLLGLMGHEVRLAHDGAQAVRTARDHPPDIVFLDIGMPGMDGYEVARQLGSLPGREAMSVIALSGYGQAADRRRSAEVGFDAHLVKPAEIETLEALMATPPGSSKTPH
ncbi:MAG TPA: PAS domain S-box protein [Steroidobacteraceae bacterium]|nr:PAS domain S-box protein [Steroidobacteraceae bacterium]